MENGTDVLPLFYEKTEPNQMYLSFSAFCFPSTAVWKFTLILNFIFTEHISVICMRVIKVVHFRMNRTRKLVLLDENALKAFLFRSRKMLL